MTTTEIKEYAINAYMFVNKLYDGNPYSVHINMCQDAFYQFNHLIPEDKLEIVLSAIYLHDVLEDCHHISYNDLLKDIGNEEVCDIVYAVTNEKGKTRKERASEKYYYGIRQTPYAVFVKLCDRIANLEYSKSKIIECLKCITRK